MKINEELISLVDGIQLELMKWNLATVIVRLYIREIFQIEITPREV